MEIHTNIPLKNHLTMKIGGNARFMTDAHDPSEVEEICKKAKQQSLPIFVIGGGSNILATDKGFNGIIVRMRIPGFEVIAEDSGSITIKLGGGENWDLVVKRSVEMNLSGIEAMSAIPGTAGAAPVQNVGAYGQEIADTLQSLEAYDKVEERFVTLSNLDCNFSYRNSIFRNEHLNRYVIVSITIKLSKNPPKPPFYETLQRYLDEQNIKLYTVSAIRNAIIEIRKNKLPDPKILPNTGSFFKNAIVEAWQLRDLTKKYPDIPSYDMGDGRFKIPTGWLIDQLGLKGQLIHGMRVYEKNALVLINESAQSYSEMAAARDEIIGKIRDTFRIEVQQEPLEI